MKKRGAAASVGAALAEAQAAHQSGDLRSAERLYRRILKKTPDYAPALNLYGILASQRGDPKNAVKRLERAIAIDGETLDYRINLGVVQETAGDFDAAVDSYTAALEQAPRNADILSRLAEAAKEANRYETFAETLNGLCAAMPDYAEAQYLYGLTLYLLQRPEEALEPLRRATALAPALTQAHANLASVLMDLGKAEEVLAACDDCLQLNPGESYALATKAIALSETGDHAQLRSLIDFDALVEFRTLEPPVGYTDIAAFNEALEAAVLAHPTLRIDPSHRSCHFADQTDDLFLDPQEPFIAFESMIRAAADGLSPQATPRREASLPRQSGPENGTGRLGHGDACARPPVGPYPPDILAERRLLRARARPGAAWRQFPQRLDRIRPPAGTLSRHQGAGDHLHRTGRRKAGPVPPPTSTTAPCPTRTMRCGSASPSTFDSTLVG